MTEFDAFKYIKEVTEPDLKQLKADIIEGRQDNERRINDIKQLHTQFTALREKVIKLQDRIDTLEEPSQEYYNSQSKPSTNTGNRTGKGQDTFSKAEKALYEKSQHEEVFRIGTTISKAKLPLSSSDGIDNHKVRE